MQAHSAWALLQGCSVVLAGCSKFAQLAKCIASVAEGSQISGGALQDPATQRLLFIQLLTYTLARLREQRR